jgi:hypothetical protein
MGHVFLDAHPDFGIFKPRDFAFGYRGAKVFGDIAGKGGICGA